MATRTALLINFLAPYRVGLMRKLQSRIEQLRIFVSTPMEPDRPWTPDWSGLNVIVQKTRTLEGRKKHPFGFEQRLFLHFPYDTLPQLFRYDPDVTISGEMGLRTLQACLYRRLRPSSRLIIWGTLSEHTEKGWGIVRRTLRRVMLRCADGVIVNGPSGARYVTGMGFPASRVFVVNQPVDVELFTRLPLDRPPEAAHRLVYSGRLLKQKGVDLLHAALAEWGARNPQRRLEIVWVGDGELRGWLESDPLPDNIRQTFVGSVQYADLPEVYRNAGIMVLPSRIDEWGLVVNEGMASGMPVLGSVYSQAVEEMVREGETGWQVDPFDLESLVAGLTRALDTPPETLAKMRAKARERALSITPDSAAEKIHHAIATVTADGTKPSLSPLGRGSG